MNKDREREKEEARKREEEIKREMELVEEIEPEEEEGERPQVSRLAIMRYIQDLSEDEEQMEKLVEDFGLLSKDSILRAWTLNKVREMSTPEIIEKLGSLDIEFDERSFRERARGRISAIDLADDFYYTRDYDADDDDLSGWRSSSCGTDLCLTESMLR